MGHAPALAELGAQIMRRRERLQLSQETLAESAGMSKNYLGQIERGHANPSFLVLIKLASALNCRVVDFFPGDRQGLSAEALAIAKLSEDVSPATREAIYTLLLPSQIKNK